MIQYIGRILIGFQLKDGYKCYDGLWIWYMLDSIVDPIWIRILRMDTNIRVGFKWAENIFKCGYKMHTNVEDEFKNWIPVGFDCWSNLDTNV